MKKVLIASTDQQIISTVKEACKLYSSYFDPNYYTDTEKIIRHINYELPEIKIIDFRSNEIDYERIMDEITEDPWLHYGGIIAIVANTKEQTELEERKNPNFLIIQTPSAFTIHFSRLLKILWQNQQFLFNRGMQEQLGAHEAGSFISENDPLDLRVYTRFLVSYLYSTNRIDSDSRYSLQASLTEMLFNALEHGNLEISYDEKTTWLEKGNDMLELIAQKCSNPKIAKRRIYISYNIGHKKTEFSIRDEGKGFDWKNYIKTDITASTHGMGIKMAEGLVESFQYNEKGNEVSFSINNKINDINSIPEIMNPFEIINYKKRQVVCHEGERTNDLFFIVSGRFAVYSGRKLAAVLTPNDMFIGEMSFLLNDRRSATVVSADEGKLIKIPKGAFIGLIRQNPHYGIFLSKLLAQRLVTQTHKTMELAESIKNTQENKMST
jgi:hypothetical protein